ncbi:adenosylcobinamide-GDP ribazoletransferase [Spirochaetota bacterium]
MPICVCPGGGFKGQIKKRSKYYMFRSFILQLQFLTRIPVPFKVKFDSRAFARGVIFSPVIGLIIGSLLGGVYLILNLADNKVLAVIFTVAAEIFITGALHLDGLADTCDGIFSNRPKKEILKIMSDPRIGTNGTIALVLFIIIKIALLYSLGDIYIVRYIIAMPIISRMNIAWSAGISAYARNDEGMGKCIIEHTGIKEIVITTVIALIFAIPFLGIISAVVIIASILFVIAFTVYLKKRIGGITGDVFGAVIELTGIIYLFTLFLAESIVGTGVIGAFLIF